jgi:hypothetical protein
MVMTRSSLAPLGRILPIDVRPGVYAASLALSAKLSGQDTTQLGTCRFAGAFSGGGIRLTNGFKMVFKTGGDFARISADDTLLRVMMISTRRRASAVACHPGDCRGGGVHFSRGNSGLPPPAFTPKHWAPVALLFHPFDQRHRRATPGR